MDSRHPLPFEVVQIVSMKQKQGLTDFTDHSSLDGGGYSGIEVF